MKRAELNRTDPFQKVGNTDWVCECPSDDGTWYLRHCTHECKMRRYSAESERSRAEDVRREKIPELVLIANVVERSLSGQYDRSDALDIAEEILTAQGK